MSKIRPVMNPFNTIDIHKVISNGVIVVPIFIRFVLLVLVTLGDGVNQNSTESHVAVGSEYTDDYQFEVYTMTHPDLSVDYKFKIAGDSAGLDVAVTTAPATDAESTRHSSTRS